MSWIVAASDPVCCREDVAGGKGASLARLCALGAPVPAFFVVSTQAFSEMNDGAFRPEFLDELRAAVSGLDLEDGVAVRSSAVGEDSAENSFAGLYRTVLNVKSIGAVISALRECWDSSRDVAAAKYRAEREAEGGAMGVVIQQMVDADWAGVCFTADPVALALSRGIINAVPGLGEALVSGEVNPEEISVSAKSGRILSRTRSASVASMADDIVQVVWRTSESIAEKIGFPQDIEWAWKAGKLYILQSRPISTIADVYYSRKLEPWRDNPLADPDDPNRIWSRMMADETWVSPISPIFYDIHNLTAARANYIRSHDVDAVLPPDIFKYHRATAYADVDVIRRMYEYQPKMARIRGVANFFPADIRDSFLSAPWRWLGRMRRALRYETQDREKRSFFHNYRVVQSQWDSYVAKSDEWFDTDLDAFSLDELRAHHAEVGREMAIVGPPCGIAVLSHASDLHLLLTGLLERWGKPLGTDGENLYARISAGLDNSDTVRIGDALWTLARDIRAVGAADLALSLRWNVFRETLLERTVGAEIVEKFETFWRTHRHLGSTYKDVIWPRWGDDVKQCFEAVKGYLSSDGPKPSAVNAKSAEARRAAQREILSAQRGFLGLVKRKILRFLFRYNELYMSVRDNHRYFVDRNWYELRRIFLSYGRRLAATGVLRGVDDVFFMGSGEIREALEGSLTAEEATRRIDVRRRVWNETLRQQGTKFLRGWAPYQERGAPVQDRHRLTGIAASPGSATGFARVIYDVKDLSTVKDGDILVTRQTDPSWTIVFGRISGLVLETGGVLSHGTSLCREYGLPCVTAVEQATVRIPDRSKIELSGSEGLVRILETT